MPKNITLQALPFDENGKVNQFNTWKSTATKISILEMKDYNVR